MRFTPGFRTYLPPQIQWQPTLTSHDPNPPIPINEGGAVTHSIELDPASFAFTGSDLSVVTKRVVELDPASFAFTARDLEVTLVQTVTHSVELLPAAFSFTANDLQVGIVRPVDDTGTPLPTGHDHRKKPKTAPYGWWDTKEEAAAELKQAETAVKAAQAEVRTEGEVQPETVTRLIQTLWWADFDSKLRVLDDMRKAQAQQTLDTINARIREQRLELARIEDEYRRKLDDEEAIYLLFN